MLRASLLTVLGLLTIVGCDPVNSNSNTVRAGSSGSDQPNSVNPTRQVEAPRKVQSEPPSVEVHALSAGVYYDSHDKDSGRLRVLASIDSPLAYGMEVLAGTTTRQLKRLVVTENTNSAGPYPILGRYFYLGSLAKTRATKVVRVHLTLGGKRIQMKTPGSSPKPFHDLRIVGGNDPTGYVGESTPQTTIFR